MEVIWHRSKNITRAKLSMLARSCRQGILVTDTLLIRSCRAVCYFVYLIGVNTLLHEIGDGDGEDSGAIQVMQTWPCIRRVSSGREAAEPAAPQEAQVHEHAAARHRNQRHSWGHRGWPVKSIMWPLTLVLHGYLTSNIIMAYSARRGKCWLKYISAIL